MGTERVVASAVEQGDNQENPGAGLLARSEHANVRFSVFLADDVSAQSVAHGELVLQKRILRTLVAEREPDGRVLLVERPLPSHGGGYLLAAAGNAGMLRHFLTVNDVRHQPCQVDGLPGGWVLESVPDCQQLSDEVMDELPTGEATCPRSRPGPIGRRPSRTAWRHSTILRTTYPAVELDAEGGTTVKAHGLTLLERRVGGNAQGEPSAASPVAEATSLRRFDIRLGSNPPLSYLIQAMYGGVAIAEVRLRIAPGSGLLTNESVDFRLDCTGDPRRGGDGLLGVRRASTGNTPYPPPAEVRGRPRLSTG